MSEESTAELRVLRGAVRLLRERGHANELRALREPADRRLSLLDALNEAVFEETGLRLDLWPPWMTTVKLALEHYTGLGVDWWKWDLSPKRQSDRHVVGMLEAIRKNIQDVVTKKAALKP